MKPIIPVLILMTLFSSCTKEDAAELNPVVQASEYVSANSEELGAIGDERQGQLDAAEDILADIQ